MAISSGGTTSVDSRGLVASHLSYAIVLIRMTGVASLGLLQMVRVVVTDGSGLSVVAGTIVNRPMKVCRSSVLRKGVVVDLISGVRVAARHHATEETRLLLLLLVDGTRARAIAGGVVIARRGPKTLLLAMVAGERELGENGEDEEENGDDSDSETGRLELTSCAEAGESSEATRAFLCGVARLTTSKGSIDVPIAAAGTMAVRNSNVDESAGKGKINGHSKESGYSPASEAPQEEESDQGVENRSSRDTLNGADGSADSQIMVVESGQEVGVDAEDECGAKELNTANKPLKELEAETCFLAHDDELLVVVICGKSVDTEGRGWGDLVPVVECR